jgi:hypothetical protein
VIKSIIIEQAKTHKELSAEEEVVILVVVVVVVKR